MGEIAEALRRARQEQAEQPDSASSAASRPGSKAKPEPQDDVYSRSASRHEAEQEGPDEAAPIVTGPDPQPAPSAPAAPASGAARRGPQTAGADMSSVELTHVGSESHAAQGVLVDDGGAVTDACLQLALRVRKALLDRGSRTLCVVSALRNEGKTTVSCNLALAMASIGRVDRVALVDLDLRRPSIETVLELSTPRVGIEEVLAGREPLSAARIHVGLPQLDVYPCLRGHPKAHDLLLDPRFEQLIDQLRDEYNVVIFDSPPALLVPDSTIILQHVDSFAPVARAGLTRARNFRKMLDTLPRRRMLGAILDGGAHSVHKGGYYEHYGAKSGKSAALADAKAAGLTEGTLAKASRAKASHGG